MESGNRKNVAVRRTMKSWNELITRVMYCNTGKEVVRACELRPIGMKR